MKKIKDVVTRFSVCSIDTETGVFKALYVDINTLDEAELLAQLAMMNKKNNKELVFISSPNAGITRFETDYKNALELADKYKLDKNEQLLECVKIKKQKEKEESTQDIINKMAYEIEAAQRGEETELSCKYKSEMQKRNLESARRRFDYISHAYKEVYHE